MTSFSLGTPDVKLTKEQRKNLYDALLSAFTADELDRLVYLELELNLYEIAPKEASSAKVLTEFVHWLERKGRVAEFVEVAYRVNPSNPNLRAVAKELGFVADAPPKARLQHMLEQFAREFDMAPDLPQRGKFERMLESFARELDLHPTPEVDRQKDQARLVPRQYANVPQFLRWLSNAAQRVCTVEVDEGSGMRFSGTGFLVGRDRVLTAYHVVERMIKHDAWDHCICRFGFEIQDDKVSIGELMKLSAEQPLIHASAYDPSGSPCTDKLNYALLRLADAVGVKRGWYSFSDVAPARPNTMIYLVHHPEGTPLKLSHPPGILYRINETKYEYIDGRTSPGSSGAPCFDEDGNLIAMHIMKDHRVFRPDGLGVAVPLTAVRDLLLASGVELT